jgi:hypothetical protein
MYQTISSLRAILRVLLFRHHDSAGSVRMAPVLRRRKHALKSTARARLSLLAISSSVVVGGTGLLAAQPAVAASGSLGGSISLSVSNQPGAIASYNTASGYATSTRHLVIGVNAAFSDFGIVGTPDHNIVGITLDCGAGSLTAPQQYTANPPTPYQNGWVTNCEYDTAGTYTLTAVATDDIGDTLTTNATVTVSTPGAPVVTQLTASPASGTAPLTGVTLTAKAVFSKYDVGYAETYIFDCGDGKGSHPATSTPTAVCDYPTASAKPYVATVQAVDSFGQTSTITSASSADVTVDPAPVVAPVAMVTLDRTTGVGSLTVHGSFTGSTASPKATGLTEFTYDCGDGKGSVALDFTPSTDTFTCSYSAPGTFKVSGTVTDSSGLTSAPVVQQVVVSPVPPPPAPTPTATRLGGGDRIATSVVVADAAYGTTKAKVAVISRSDSFADALAGNALAAEKDGPLLLTGSGALDARVGAELQKILSPGATVYVLGGHSALSPQVEADIAKLNLVPKRLEGQTRFDTAVAIANEISPHPHSVLVATGLNSPDALAAGAAAAADPAGGVVLLSQDGVLPEATKNYLAGVDSSKADVYAVGGQAASALKAQSGLAGHFTPLAGDDRYLTDVAVASNATLFPEPTVVGLATGRDWPDALSGGAFIGAKHGPLLLTDGANVPSETTAWMQSHGAHLTALTVFGGVNAVPYDAARSLAAAAWGPTAWINEL